MSISSLSSQEINLPPYKNSPVTARWENGSEKEITTTISSYHAHRPAIKAEENTLYLKENTFFSLKLEKKDGIFFSEKEVSLLVNKGEEEKVVRLVNKYYITNDNLTFLTPFAAQEISNVKLVLIDKMQEKTWVLSNYFVNIAVDILRVSKTNPILSQPKESVETTSSQPKTPFSPTAFVFPELYKDSEEKESKKSKK